MRGFVSRVSALLGSSRFYWIILAFFVFEALWVAFSAVYPMAFDEDFHLGVIRIYSEQWSPFLAGQPENANMFGALATDPSYLYHYLMSFPYRFISLFTDSQTAHVIVLRLINVAIITAGVMLFRKVLLRAGTSSALTNTAIVLFALIPTVPLLAGQINYDSLILLALAWVCWLVLGITEDLRTRKFGLKTYSLFAVALMLACLVKYAFLPLALAAFLYVVFMVWRTFRKRSFWAAVKKSYAGLSRRALVGLIALLLVSGGLFMQRYGVNLVSYGHPVAPCDAVIGVEACMEYGPWGRNYRLAAENPGAGDGSLAYTWVWLQSLHYRLFFMITGPPKHTNYPPAVLPSAAVIMIVIFAVSALLFYWRKVFAGRQFLVFVLLMAVTYIGVLWSQNYEQYLETGQPVAINGRYLIPLLLPLAAVLGRALSVALKSWPNAKVWAAAIAIMLFMQGGGIFSFILRSDRVWYWPNAAVVEVNETANDALSKVMLIGPRGY